MLVKVAPVGERVVEVNTVNGETIADVLAIAGVEINGRRILLDNKDADETTKITRDGSVVVLAQKMKGGR